jgi:hypothetical protein
LVDPPILGFVWNDTMHSDSEIAALCSVAFHHAEMFDLPVVTREHRNSMLGEEKYRA